jgi:hypothetical protein
MMGVPTISFQPDSSWPRAFVISMEAMFISGSLAKVLPIAYVEDMKKDAHNKLLRTIINRYNEMVDELAVAAKMRYM